MLNPPPRNSTGRRYNLQAPVYDTGHECCEGGPRTNGGITPPTTAPPMSAQLPAPRKETNNPASEPIPAPTTISMMRFAMSFVRHLYHSASAGWRKEL